MLGLREAWKTKSSTVPLQKKDWKLSCRHHRIVVVLLSNYTRIVISFSPKKTLHHIIHSLFSLHASPNKNREATGRKNSFLEIKKRLNTNDSLCRKNGNWQRKGWHDDKEKKTLQKCHFNFDSLDEIIDCLFNCIVYKKVITIERKITFISCYYISILYITCLPFLCMYFISSADMEVHSFKSVRR